MPGAVVNSPLAEARPEDGVLAKSRKRKNVQPAPDALPDKRTRKPARDPVGNEYVTAGRGRGSATRGTGAQATRVTRSTGTRAARGTGTKAARGTGRKGVQGAKK